MKHLQRASIFWFLLVLISGCQSLGAPAPETNIERMTYVESAYGVILDRATVLRDEGRFSASQIKSTTQLFDDYEEARGLALIAISISDQGGFESHIGTINAALAAIRVLITEAE